MKDDFENDLREKFFEAFLEWLHWPRIEEPCLNLKRRSSANSEPVPISAVCNLVERSVEGRMPDNIFLALFERAGREEQEELGKDQSYATGARILYRWIERTKTKMQDHP
jgi:hypothetical protein